MYDKNAEGCLLDRQGEQGMRKKNLRYVPIAGLVMAVVFIIHCAAMLPVPIMGQEPDQLPEQSEQTNRISLYIGGSPGGPELTKVILDLGQEVHEIHAGDVRLETEGIVQKVYAVYLCDENGEPLDLAEGEYARYTAFDISGKGLTSAQAEGSGQDPQPESPGPASLIVLDEYSMKYWPDSYHIMIEDPEFTIDGTMCGLMIEEDCIESRICPDIERFDYRGSYSNLYQNPMTGNLEKLTIQMAAYEPDSLAGGEKNPLLIWLHGFSEGGQELEMCVLGIGADALARDPVQSEFMTGDVKGAYVLIPQCPTYWMDEGDAEHYTGCGVSMFTQTLKDLIDSYLVHNPDADPRRIYIGGASNGAYMTMNMLEHYPDMFAAAFPVCGGYSYYAHVRDEAGHIVFADDPETGEDSQPISDTQPAEADTPPAPVTDLQGAILDNKVYFTEDMTSRICHIPIWFISSADDGVLAPWVYVLPDYCALKQAGAEHCFVSMFSAYDHSVWQPVIRNEVTGVQDGTILAGTPIPDAAHASIDSYPLQPTDDGGGSQKADGYDNLFAWLNAQALEQ